MTKPSLARQLCPPILLDVLAETRDRVRQIVRAGASVNQGPLKQELDLYWDESFAQTLETWGEGTAWTEIQLLLANVDGPVLDIACGTGKVSELLQRFAGLDLYGCDISDLLIAKAHARGLPRDRFIACDATSTPFDSALFRFGFSIGSLEHFTEDGIGAFARECRRIVRESSFHHIPTARDGRDHGWITTTQSYFNNSVDWWLTRLRVEFPNAYVIDSSWGDRISVGKWIVCPTERRTK